MNHTIFNVLSITIDIILALTVVSVMAIYCLRLVISYWKEREKP